MVAHFSAEHNHSIVPSLASGCLDPQSCLLWLHTVEEHMGSVLIQAEQDFTDFLEYDPHRIICLDEQVVEEVDRLGLSWRAFAQTIRDGYILEWYDREALLPLLQAQQKSQGQRSAPTRYQMTLRSGRQTRPKSVQDLDARSEYRATPGRYRMMLRCLFPSAAHAAPLLVEATYDTPTRAGETWVLHIGAVLRPAAEKWNNEFTQLMCRCGEAERTTSYDSSPSFLSAPRHV